jgi:hypothetical protein
MRNSTRDLTSSNNTVEMMTDTHGRSRYTRGCRCNVCITAERDLTLAQTLHNPKAINQQPATAKVLASLLEKLVQPLSAASRAPC